MIERVPVLTIAGSDSSGGAGIQADLKTMTVLQVYGMSAITALTAQNTTGVQGIFPVPADFLHQQLCSVCEDIVPKAVKTGMIACAEQVRIICSILSQYALSNVVVDPVMVATTGATLTQQETIAAMQEQLFPLATLITPNLAEAAFLLERPVQNVSEMEQAAKQLAKQYHTAVLIKGGHLTTDAMDVLYDGEQIHLFRGERLQTKNTHGTGCTLSSAIAAKLAVGCTLQESVRQAKIYVASCIRAGLQLGHGNGTLCHNVGKENIE